MAEEKKIVVLGAGVIGLTTAMLLARNPHYRITILAKHLPGDQDIEYASPAAGANYEPVGTPGSNLARYERNSWAPLAQLAANVPAAGIHFQKTVSLNRKKDADSPTAQLYSELFAARPWFADVVPDFRPLTPAELPAGYDSGSAFTSVCINVPLYLAWLLGRCLAAGICIHRAHLAGVRDALGHPCGRARHADVVVNCTGLASRTLGGVQDPTLFPVRGQLLLVRNEAPAMVAVSGTDDSEEEVSYVMMRAAGGGTIIGGSAQKDNWDSNVDPELEARIKRRAVKLMPELVGKGQDVEGLDIVRNAVGLRPFREKGPRVEKEIIDGGWVVHNYGHGGFGYQSSYGSAAEAVALVDSIFKERARL